MRTSLNHLRYPSRSNAAKLWFAILVALTVSVGAALAGAQTNQVIVTQSTRLFTLSPSGGWGGSSSPLGGTFAVNQAGDVVFFSEYTDPGLFLINSQTGAMTQLNNVSNSGSVAVDNQNNIYYSQTYSSQIAKIPYNAVTGTYAAYPSGGPTTNCTGAVNTTTDTTTCIFALNLQDKTGYYGVAALAIDPAGNFWMAANQWPGSATNNATVNNTIFLCNAACQTGTQYDDPPTAVYTDTVATDAIGAIAFDPWGNLFFTDGAYNETTPGSGGPNTSSGLYELTNSGGKYASTPTQLVSFTNTQGYNDDLSGVAVDGNGTIYYTITGGGVFAIPNTQTGGPDLSNEYAISTIGGKGITLDSKGNVYVNAYTTTDGVTRISVGNIAVPAGAVGGKTPPQATNVEVILNDSNCSSTPAPTVNFALTENGVATTEFAAAIPAPVSPATTSCSTLAFGSNGGSATFPVTMTFTPTTVGERVAVVTATDSDANVGSAVAAGVGQGPFATFDPGVLTSYSTGFTEPAAAVADAAGDLYVADSGANAVYKIASGTTTLTSIGTGFNEPSGLALDANGNIFVADSGNNQIVELPNASGSVDGSNQTVVVASTVTFGGAALKFPSGLAYGPDGVLYIADTPNNRVVSWNPSTGLTAVAESGLDGPTSLAVDSSNNLYVGNASSAGKPNVMVFSVGGAVTTLSPSTIKQPEGVAVDASGSVLISDDETGNVVRIPNQAGTLNGAASVVVLNEAAAGPIALDSSGNLYMADGTNKAVYAVQRNAASLNFGSVDDDSTVDVPLYVESAGNMPLMLGNPIFTAPSNKMFSLAEGSRNGCTSSSGAVGTACEFTASFTPANATASGAETGTSTISSNALNAPSATVSFNGTAVFENLQLQTISFTPPAKIAFTTKPVVLSATDTSKLPVSFSLVSGPAKLKGDELTITGIGSIVIAANQAGNSTWAPAPTVTKTIAVVKATQTISFTPKATFTYPVTALYMLSATASSGLPVKFAVISGPATIVGAQKNELKITGAGTVKVSANQAGNADYDAAPQNTKPITVRKGTQTISFTMPSTLPYGKTIVLAATSTSKLPVTFSVISGPATLKGDNLTITGVGKVKVGANQLGNSNYDAAVEKYQTATAEPATLDVTATNLSMTQGSAVPQLTYTISGFAKGDKQANVVTGTALLSTTATSSSAPGKYPIKVSLGTLQTTTKYKSLYTLKPVNGVMTVTKSS